MQPQNTNNQASKPNPPAVPQNYPVPQQYQPYQPVMPNSESTNGVYNPFAYYPQNPQQMMQQQYGQFMPINRKILNELRNKEASKLIYKTQGRPWASFALRPSFAFANQNLDETVYVVVRRHWISNLGWVLRNVFYILIPPIFFFIIVNFNINVSFISLRAFFLAFLMYYSVTCTNIIKLFTDWFFDPFIVTNERILDYDFKPFGTYYVAELDLENIQDIKEISSGILGQLFNYGSIEILSANSNVKMDFKDVPNPTKVRDIITELSKIAKTYKYGDI